MHDPRMPAHVFPQVVEYHSGLAAGFGEEEGRNGDAIGGGVEAGGQVVGACGGGDFHVRTGFGEGGVGAEGDGEGVVEEVGVYAFGVGRVGGVEVEGLGVGWGGGEERDGGRGGHAEGAGGEEEEQACKG